MADLCMRLWALQVNLWLLALVTGGISADKNNTSNSTGSVCPSVHQHPRYVAIKKNMPIYFVCYSDDPKVMQWYKIAEKSEDVCGLDSNTSQYTINRTDTFINLTILRATFEDSAIYVCDRKNILEKKHLHACGTELKVVGHSSLKQIQNRNTLKDAIIIIQSILLVIFISIPILLLLDKGEGKKDPEEDHTYEGLEVEQMATYEDITPFRDVKAKWTVGEHPGEE
ncbi:B-cell antigen receptor complex-associated protein beta chain [Neopelma chrysocephalum]|uniref:B-cell antigen receptor complex-associated protein beta chain n=1 Tax=Neopelma chrysocephalum TaxID=114329 RepID=UPI000FCD007B|nr:B-cell antigen receptor complex-associated protein beta chain [Neopelma chrysocephalum]